MATIYITGEFNASSSNSGTLSAEPKLAGSSDAVSSGSGKLSAEPKLAGSSDAVATGSSTMTFWEYLAGSSDAVATGTGAMARDRGLRSVSEALSSLAGSLEVGAYLRGVVTAVSSLVGALSTDLFFSVVNIAPVPGTVSGVKSRARFGIRNSSAEVVKELINVYWGTGPSFYKGEVLPEDHETLTFMLAALSANPVALVDRAIEPGGELKLTKSGATSQKGVYEFGGLESPAAPDAPMMVEFELGLAEADVIVDGNDFTGVVVGLKINDTGINIKFFSDGATRSIQIHDAIFATVASPGPAYEVDYDWDQGRTHLYKLLWHPQLDVVRLYVSTTQNSLVSDVVLIDGAVSDFPGPLPAIEIPAIQPIAYFGHAYPTPESISYWHEVFLYNLVSMPVRDGVFQGEHVGFIHTDEVTLYPADTLPKDAAEPWLPLPDSFGTIDGMEWLTVEPRLRMVKADPAASYGYFRYEPRVSRMITVLDFKVSGRVHNGDPSSVSTGMEVFICTGTKEARFALLDLVSSQMVGLLTNADAASESSYVGLEANWLSEFSYRMVFDPAGNVSIYLLSELEGVTEELIASVAVTSLPDSTLPGPALGFLINGQASQSLVEMRVGRLRYSTSVRDWDVALPSPPWVEHPLPTGTGGSITEAGVDEVPGVTIDNSVVDEPLYIKRAESILDPANGAFLEFRAEVDSFEVSGEVDPIRELTGVGVSIDTGSDQVTLLFADAGSLGSIVFFATDADYSANLLKIRAGDSSIEGTYASVNWSLFKLYRIERTPGVSLRLYVDDAEEAVLDLDLREVVLPGTVSSTPEVRFGSLMDDRKSQSKWQLLRYGISSGYDIEGYPNLDEDEVLRRFDHAVNVIVEA
jgi:hypothetical protein